MLSVPRYDRIDFGRNVADCAANLVLDAFARRHNRGPGTPWLMRPTACRLHPQHVAH